MDLRRPILAIYLLLLACSFVQSELRGRRAPILRQPKGTATTGCYFVVFKDKTKEGEMEQAMATISKYADNSRIYSVVKRVSKAITVKLSPIALELVSRMPAVDYVEEEGFAVGTQSIPEWHLDRLDQVLPTLDHTYWPIGDGHGVDVYILDSGIIYEHEEFEYRAKYPGRDPTDEYNVNFPEDELRRQYGRDCHGHGTHVASLCGGKTYGSAKKATLYSVRVLGCNNAGPWSGVLDGIDFVVRMAERTNRPSIMSMSFSGGFYQVMEDAVNVALSRGVMSVVAAGNGQKDACSRSPASNRGSITVGGTRQGDGLYLLGSGTNFGRCIDIFAPGERVLAADSTCTNCSKHLSGTSMSTPLVSGLAAVILEREPLLSPSGLKERLINQSTKGIIDYTGMPESLKSVTPNRLANVPGSCGEKQSRFGHFSIFSPNFPNPYPPNLDCRWEIGGLIGITINIHIHFLNLETYYDSLRVYDGCCEDKRNLQRQFTGNLRNADFSFNSTGNMVCIQLLTDGTVSAQGFNGTYTKFYSGTTLMVPNPNTPAPPGTTNANVDVPVRLLTSPRQARDQIKTLMNNGYKLTWITSYRLGPDKTPFFDFVASNSSLVNTISYVDIGYNKLNRSIHEMKEQGYFVSLLIDRIRGPNPTEPSYSVIFSPRDAILETQVNLRDSYEDYLSRLARNTAAGFRILSQSFCSIQDSVEVATVFTRDRRIPLNIPAPRGPAIEVRSNMTFFQFTRITLQLAADGFFPSAVEAFTQGSTTNSFFSVIYQQRGENTFGNWFRWSLNTTAARDLIEKETSQSWDVYLTVGYTYIGNTEHFVEFRRKGAPLTT